MYQVLRGLRAQGFVCDRAGERRRAQVACTAVCVGGEGRFLGGPAMLRGRRGVRMLGGWQQCTARGEAASHGRVVTAPPAARAGGT